MVSVMNKSQRIAATIRERIETGAWTAGMMLPPERELAEEFDVSRITLRAALATVQDAGLLERLRGKGTFVSQHAESNGLATMAILLSEQNFSTDDPFLSFVTHGIRQALQDEKVATTFHSLGTHTSLADFLKNNLDLVQSWDGLLTYSGAVDADAFALLQERRIAVVGLGESMADHAMCYVDIDNETGGEMAMRYLLDRGRRKPLIVEGSRRSIATDARMRGIHLCLAEAGVSLDKQAVLHLSPSYTSESADAAQEAVEERLAELGKEIDCVYAFHEQSTIGVYRALKRHELTIGSDVAVIHYNDYPWLGQMLRPAPTAIRQPFTVMARDAARLLLRHIQQPGRPVEQRILQPILMVRQSCGE